MGDCGFQEDAFQNNAFQVCVTIPPETIHWPGPSIVLYREGETDTRWLRQIQKEDEEFMIL